MEYIHRRILNNRNGSELQITVQLVSDIRYSGSVDDNITLIFQWMFSGGMCLGIALFGIVTNIINITCFVVQGFKDPVNISFVGLAISDIGCLVTHFWANLCYTPAFAEADLPFDSKELQYLTSSMPHTAFVRVTSWITALITLERCLCILAPLKVRNIITRKRVFTIIVFVFIVLIFSTAPIYVVNRLGFKFYPAKNKTLLGLLYTKDRERVERVSYIINNATIPGTSFLVIIICTGILVFQLRKKNRWRKKTTSAIQKHAITNKNQKVAKMVLFISSLFIACFIPVSLFFVAMTVEPGLNINGKHKNYFTIFGGLVMMLEAANSSGSIFIYYYMSSKFRNTFQTFVCKQCRKRNV